MPVILCAAFLACAKTGTQRQAAAEPAHVSTAQDTVALSVHDVFVRPLLDHSVVVVRGRCLAYTSELAPGPAPTTRSDWLLQGEDSAVVYVTGPVPAGCDLLHSTFATVKIIARVASDTIRIGPLAGRARRFLVMLR